MSRISQIDILDYQHPQPMPDDVIIRYTMDDGLGWIEVRHKGTYLEIMSGGSTSAIRLLVQPWVSNQIRLSLEPEYRQAPRLLP